MVAARDALAFARFSALRLFSLRFFCWLDFFFCAWPNFGLLFCAWPNIGLLFCAWHKHWTFFVLGQTLDFLVLGQTLFEALQTPDEHSLVLPQDRVIPFLGSGGTLLRSTTLPCDHGMLVALGGDPVDLVIAKDISVDFLQVTPDPAYVFRLHEKLVLRIMSPGAICGFRLKHNAPSSPKAPVNRSTGSK